jgi:hypothetical protein
LARSALVEGIAQVSRALEQMATLAATPALRQEQIELQVAVIVPLMHLKGFSSPEPKAAAERARVMIEQAEALGEPLENALMLYLVLWEAFFTNIGAFNGMALSTLTAQFLALAEKQEAAVPILLGHTLMAYSLVTTGNFAQGRTHCDYAIALHDPAHQPLALLFGLTGRVEILALRSLALWFLGYPEAAVTDANQSLKEARDLGDAGILFQVLNYAIVTHFLRGDYATTEALANDLLTFADEQKSLVLWKPAGLLHRGWLFAVTNRASEAIQQIITGFAPYQSTGSTKFDAGWIIVVGEKLRRA